MLSHLYLLSLPPARNINLNYYLSHYVDWLNGAPQNIIQEKFPIMCLLQLFLQQMKYQMCVSGALLEYGARSHGKGFQVLTCLFHLERLQLSHEFLPHHYLQRILYRLS